MAERFRMSRRVEFAETDAAGIAHFSSFIVYMEQAEHALLRDVGLSVYLQDEAGTISWPRVSVACDYQGAAKFEDQLEVETCVTRLGSSSVTYQFEFFLEERSIAKGAITAVCCRLSPDGPPKSIPIPNGIREMLSRYLCEPAV